MTFGGFRALLLASVVGIGMVGCSDSTSTNPDGGQLTGPVSNATLTITSPASGDTVYLDSSATVPVTYTVTNFTLQPPGACGGNAQCGHVDVLVDGYNCQGPLDSANVQSADTTALADLKRCASAMGAHSITAELHYDDGSVVVGPDGKFVSQTVNVMASPPPPALSVSSPAANDHVFLADDADSSVQIQFTTQYLTLVDAPGKCNGDPACGILVVNVDGDACDDPNFPAPLNNYGTTSPLAAKFAFCQTPTGAHTITLTVLDDTGMAPLMVQGQPLQVSIPVTAHHIPTFTITSPAASDTVSMGTDAKNTVPLVFDTNLTLEPGPGSGVCTPGDPTCGFLILNIDGDACDDPNAPFPINNSGATSSPMDAYFAYCPTPAGTHTANITVLDDNGDPLTYNGTPLGGSVTFTTQ